MSRSIHKTVMGVLGGRSKEVMEAMTNPESPDPDVEELWKKKRYKKKEKSNRALASEGSGGEIN